MELSVPTRYVVAGELVASKRPLELRTVLGSCVSACLFDPTARIGGMNHFLLPEANGEPPTARYGAVDRSAGARGRRSQAADRESIRRMRDALDRRRRRYGRRS